MKAPILVQAGDVCFTNTTSFLGNLIRWIETDPGETSAWTGHTLLILWPGYLTPTYYDGEATVTESVNRVRIGPFMGKPGTMVKVYRPIPYLLPSDIAILRNQANLSIGQKYGWWKLLFHLVDRIVFKGRKIFSSLLFLDKRPICSYYVAHLFANVRRTFGMDPDVADPDEMLDYCEEHPEQWEYIGEQNV